MTTLKKVWWFFVGILTDGLFGNCDANGSFDDENGSGLELAKGSETECAE